MESIKKLVSGKDDPLKELVERRKYVSHEHQDFGLRIASKLGESDKISLYIKLVKEKPRALIMQAFSFAVDYPEAKNRGKLFMWKLKELEKERGKKEVSQKDETEKKENRKETRNRDRSKKPPKKKRKKNEKGSSGSGKRSRKQKKDDILEGDQITFA